MPTLYDASKKLRKLPDSIYGTSKKLSSISLSRMAVADTINQQNENIPSGVVIDARDLDRRVQIFLIKLQSIATYLQQIPSASTSSSSPPVARQLNFEGAGRRSKMKGGADEYDPEDTDRLISELEDLIGDVEEINPTTPTRDDIEGLEELRELLNTIADRQRRSGMDTERIEHFTDLLDDYIMNGEGDLNSIINDAHSVMSDVENNMLSSSQEKQLGISSKLINFNALFGRSSSSVDDALIYFNENIAPYKKSLTAVQIENINKKLDDINVIFRKVYNSPVILSLSSNTQTYEPLDQLKNSFTDLRISIRAVINSAKMGYNTEPNSINPANPNGSEGMIGGSMRRKKNTLGDSAPSLSLLSKYKNCSQKFLL